MKKKSVHEGDWFAVPLRAGGFAMGIVARKGRRGILFGYFFGPRREVLPTMEDTRGLQAESALMCRQFGDLGLIRGEWPVLGRLEPWDRSHWPMPAFGRIAQATGLAWEVRYPGDDPSAHGEARRCSIEDAQGLVPEGLLGAGAVELLLTKKLTD